MKHVTRNKFPAPIKRAEIMRSWRDRGYSCDVFTDPPGREWNDFVHGTNELITVVVGKLRVTIAGVETIAEPGDELFIPKGAYHSVKNIHSSTTKWFYGYD